MEDFLSVKDPLSKDINENAQKLYHQLSDLPIDELNISEFTKSYFKKHHYKRAFFSIQTAAELLYRAIKHSGKAPNQLTVMDYGAGVGSLYLLAKMIGCKQVIYNDIVGEVLDAGKAIAENLGIQIDYYALGDYPETIAYLKENDVTCDLVLSRNVIEHIYNLKSFYQQFFDYNPQIIFYNSTTANDENVLMRWYHYWVHKNAEKTYWKERLKIIQKKASQLTKSEQYKLANYTRGLALEDLNIAIKNYTTNKQLPTIHTQTNTCDPHTGIWAENLLPLSKHQQMIREVGGEPDYEPAFWDTHYAKSIINKVTRLLNKKVNKQSKEKAMAWVPFIYVIAQKH